MNIIPLIIKREFIAKIQNKSFIIMTFISPILFVAVSTLIGYLSTLKTETKKIALHDETGLFIKDFTKQNKTNKTYQYVDFSAMPLPFLKDSIVAKNQYEGLLQIPKTTELKNLETKIEFISNNAPSLDFIEETQQIIAKRITQNNYITAHLDTLAIHKAEAEITLNLLKTSGETSIKGINEIKIALGGAFGYLIMMFIIIYGNMVMRSIIEEKTNRIVEIIISSIKPFQLMIGKIIGTSLAGILQFLIWISIGLFLMILLPHFIGIPNQSNLKIHPEILSNNTSESFQMIQMYLKEILNLPLTTLLISFIIYFIGGYFLYSSFYAAIGAAVDSETDTQQFVLPIIMPLILGVYIGFFTIMKNPDSNVAFIFSMLPFTSPIVMLMRIPFGVPLWQIIISIILLFSTFLLVVWFASKIYRIGILMHGKKTTWKELFKWLKY